MKGYLTTVIVMLTMLAHGQTVVPELPNLDAGPPDPPSIGDVIVEYTLEVSGPVSIGNDPKQYTCVARLSDGSATNVTEGVNWSVTPLDGFPEEDISISDSGLLTVTGLTLLNSDSRCEVQASYLDEADTFVVAIFVPLQPELTSPQHRSRVEGRSPTLTWAPLEGVRWYRVLVTHKLNDYVTIADRWLHDVTEFTIEEELFSGSYNWKVIALAEDEETYSDWSFRSTFSVGVPSIPELIPLGYDAVQADKNLIAGAPVNNALQFRWTKSDSLDDGFYTWYQLWIEDEAGNRVNNEDLGNGWFTEKPGNPAEVFEQDTNIVVNVEFGKQLDPGMYTWWVQGYDAAGPGLWSKAQQFALGLQIEPGVLGTEPLEPLAEVRPTLRWKEVEAATHYNLMLENWGSGSEDNIEPVTELTFSQLQGDNYSMTEDLSPGRWQWTVQPINPSTGWTGERSPWADFLIE